MDRAAQAKALADFVAFLRTGEPWARANKPADIAAASAGLPSCAVGWGVAIGHRCSDAVLARMGPDAAWLPEDETRRGIEFSVLSALRRLTADVHEFPLSPDQVSLAHKMARHGLPYERYMTGIRLVPSAPPPPARPASGAATSPAGTPSGWPGRAFPARSPPTGTWTSSPC